MFPSPCGEKVGINRKDKASQTLRPLADVSVPLRGKGRDQLRTRKAECQPSELVVSVPLRGKGRDQHLDAGRVG